MNSTVSRIFSDDTIKVFILLLSLIMSESCIRKKFHPGDYADSQESYLDSDKTRDFGDGIGFELFHPDQARVTLSVAEVKAQDFGKDFPLPGFDIQQNRNDYVMILRCQESYRISFLEELSAVETSGHKKGQWLWLDSLGNPSLCKIASRRLNGTRFEDMGASDGSFFYVVNPCVSEGLSSTGADGCSYLLAVSNTVSYRNSPGSQFLRISAELADAESAYDAVMSRLLGLSKRLMNSKSSCEFAINRQESQENVRKFGWDLLSAGVAVAGVFAIRGTLKLFGKTSWGNQKSAQGYQNSLKKTMAFLQEIGADKDFRNRATQVTAGIFAAALAIHAVLERFSDAAPDTTGVDACQQADKIATEIIGMQESRVLDNAMEEVIRMSMELHKLDSRFEGYSEKTFEIK